MAEEGEGGGHGGGFFGGFKRFVLDGGEVELPGGGVEARDEGGGAEANAAVDVFLVVVAVKLAGGAGGEVGGDVVGLFGPGDDDAAAAVGSEEAAGVVEGAGDGFAFEGEGFAGAVDFEVDGGEAGGAGVDAAGEVAGGGVFSGVGEHGFEVGDGGVDHSPGGLEEEGDLIGGDLIEGGHAVGLMDGAEGELGDEVVGGEGGGVEGVGRGESGGEVVDGVVVVGDEAEAGDLEGGLGHCASPGERERMSAVLLPPKAKLVDMAARRGVWLGV